ncbi:MAG: hypothetical protein R3B93_25155 [Bacteroidia bacterium]
MSFIKGYRVADNLTRKSDLISRVSEMQRNRYFLGILIVWKHWKNNYPDIDSLLFFFCLSCGLSKCIIMKKLSFILILTLGIITSSCLIRLKKLPKSRRIRLIQYGHRHVRDDVNDGRTGCLQKKTTVLDMVGTMDSSMLEVAETLEGLVISNVAHKTENYKFKISMILAI